MSDYMKEAERLLAEHEQAAGLCRYADCQTTRSALLAHIQRGAPAPAEVPMPEPDTHCYDEDERRDVWSHSADQMRTYGAACRAAGEAAGYARGLADERERCASVAWAHYMDTCRRKGIGPDVLPDWCCAAALRGEVKP